MTNSVERGRDFLDAAASNKQIECAILPAVGKSPSLFDDEGRKKSQATLLIELCSALKLFHDGDLSGYAIVPRSSWQEVWPIQSKAFRNWLSHEYFKLTEKGVSRPALVDALGTIEARAQFQAPKRDVHMRVAWKDECIYIDLADERWRVVKIDRFGWRVLDQSPVMFTRRKAMAPLPTPVDGNLADLSTLLNVAKQDVVLVIGWLLMAARGRGPYPILILNGEQGTGKSTLTRILRNLIDPSSTPLRGLTRDLRDLQVTTTNNHVVVLDNLSGMTSEISDALCRIASGGGFAARQLYTDNEEVIINVQRPIILNGIDEIATRGDLMERAITLQLPVIPDTDRTDEETTWRLYDDLRPSLLGGIYTALSHALRELPTTKLCEKPRMADFAVWVEAADGALGALGGTFYKAFSRNQGGGVESALEASPFGEALVRFMDQRTKWSGTATDLLNAIDLVAHIRLRDSQSWPRTGKGVSNALRRLSPLLRRAGISINTGRREGANGRRLVEIEKRTKESSVSSVPTASNKNNEIPSDGALTIG